MEIPSDVRDTLQDKGQLEQLQALPPSHRREYLQWIMQAKRPETRQKRIAKMCEMLDAKVK